MEEQIVKPSDKEIERALQRVMCRLENGNLKRDAWSTSVTAFSAVFCRDGKIRMTQWYNNNVNTSGIMLSDKIANLGDIDSNFDTRGQYQDDKGFVPYTEDMARSQMFQARDMMGEEPNPGL